MTVAWASRPCIEKRGRDAHATILLSVYPLTFLELYFVSRDALDAQRDVRLARELDLPHSFGVVSIDAVFDDLEYAIDGRHRHVPRIENLRAKAHSDA